jgi:hypothetical protein
MQAVHARTACNRKGELRHEQHRPQQTLLYQLVERHYPHLLDTLA